MKNLKKHITPSNLAVAGIAVVAVGSLVLYSRFLGNLLDVVSKQADELTDHIISTATEK